MTPKASRDDDQGLWRDSTLIGFDIETSGKYPLSSEICEIAAAKWRNGQIVDEFQTLVRVRVPMGEEVIAIHHITNEMLNGAPSVETAVLDFHKFIADGFLVAHHAPFDMGFLAIEMERVRLALPKRAVFCSSLLSRKAFSNAPNHRLQTLIQYFQLIQGTAHRALDDARACLSVALKCFEKVGSDATIATLLDYQSVPLMWSHYSVADLRSHAVYGVLVEALEAHKDVQIIYSGGSRPGVSRTVHPVGLVRNPNGDFFVACDEGDTVSKRFFLNKITAARL